MARRPPARGKKGTRGRQPTRKPSKREREITRGIEEQLLAEKLRLTRVKKPSKREREREEREIAEAIADQLRAEQFGLVRFPSKKRPRRKRPEPKAFPATEKVGKLDPASLLRLIVTDLDSASYTVSEYEPLYDEYVRGEVWHRYGVYFREPWSWDFLTDVFDVFRKVLGPHYRRETLLYVFVETDSDSDGDVSYDWRSLTSTMAFQEAFGQIPDEIEKWEDQKLYGTTFRGVAVFVRAPEHYVEERGL